MFFVESCLLRTSHEHTKFTAAPSLLCCQYVRHKQSQACGNHCTYNTINLLYKNTTTTTTTNTTTTTTPKESQCYLLLDTSDLNPSRQAYTQFTYLLTPEGQKAELT